MGLAMVEVAGLGLVLVCVLREAVADGLTQVTSASKAMMSATGQASRP